LRFVTGILLSKGLFVSCIETDDCKSWTVHTFSMPVCRYVISKNSNVSTDFIRKLAWKGEDNMPLYYQFVI
jgi:hypothetical protein